MVALFAACSMPGDAAQVVKIGLIAPFEGVGRPLGYAVLPEVKAAIADANAEGVFGHYRVALVALNDDLDPSAAASQARALAQDSAILAVIGPFGQDTAAAAAPLLSAAGIPAFVAAPLDAALARVISLCPPTNEISSALRRLSEGLSSTVGGPPPLVFFPGDAVMAADQLLRRRSEGWSGILVSGPDVLRPWFIQQAGPAAEGIWAAACSLDGASVPPGDVLPEVALATAGTRALLTALATDIQAHGRPSRAGVAAALDEQALVPQVTWYRVVDGAWAPVSNSIAVSPDAPAVVP